jgi:hypothetical protein
LQQAPDIPGAIIGALEVAFGIYTHQKDAVAEGGKKVLNEASKTVSAMQKVRDLYDSKHVLAVQLGDLVPKFSSTNLTTSALGCSVLKKEPGLFDISNINYSLWLTNTSGRDLHNCVIVVRSSNQSANSFLNYYYVENWKSGEIRATRFSKGDLPRTAIDDPVRFDFSLWTAECFRRASHSRARKTVGKTNRKRSPDAG